MGSCGRDDSPQRTIPLAHADATQDPLLVCLDLPQVLAHDVTAQAEAHDHQLGEGVGLFDVVHHGSKLPRAACGRKGEVMQSFQVYQTLKKMQAGGSLDGANTL